MKNDILYSFRRCPYAIRARWALLICETKVEIREIDLKNKPLDFLNNSKTKTVPILIKKNSEVIEESLEIILWALSESKKENIKLNFFPENKKEDIFEIINENDNEFKYHLDRFKYATRYKDSDEEFHFTNAIKFIKRWNDLLEENKGKWFRSHLLGREIELGELYSLGSNELDLLMAETAEIRSDLDFKEKNIGKFRTAGYFLELARIIEKRKLLEN